MIVEIIAGFLIASAAGGITYVVDQKKKINKHIKNQNYKSKKDKNNDTE